MPPMLVTLDVSKLSGWLNFGANCQVARERSYKAGCEVRAEAAGRWVAAVLAACRRGLSAGGWGEATHSKHVVHVCDA